MPLIHKPTTLHRSEYVHGSYTVIAKAGSTLDDVISPDFWSNVQPVLKHHDLLTVLAQDNSFEVSMRVVDPRKSTLRFRLVYVYDASEEAATVAPAAPIASPSAELKVEWAGRSHKWRIVDTRTAEVISHGHDDKEAALAAMSNIVTARAA